MFSTRRLVIEEIRNIVASRSASLILATGTILAIAAVPVANFLDAHRALELDRQFHEAGIAVAVVTRSDRQPLSTERCLALGAIGGVQHSGAISAPSMVTISSRPNQRVELIRGSEGVAPLIWPNDYPADLRASSAIVGASIAQNYGLTKGSLIDVQNGGQNTLVRVDHTAHSTTRSRAADLTIFVRDPKASAVSCLVEMSPDAIERVSELLGGWWGDEEIIVSPLFVDASHSYEPLSKVLALRLGQWITPATFVLLLVGAVVYTRARRWDHAVYRRLGLSIRGAVTFAIIDWLTLIALPASITTCLWMMLAPMHDDPGAAKIGILQVFVVLAALPLIPPVTTIVIRAATPSKIFVER